MITRASYCPACYAQDRPAKGSIFVTFGRGTGQYKVHQAALFGTRGYVPTLFTLVKTSRGIVHFTKTCAMHKCGVTVRLTGEDDTVEIVTNREEAGRMPISDWNALVQNTDMGYFLD